jgi:hypothetical protein
LNPAPDAEIGGSCVVAHEAVTASKVKMATGRK